MAALLFTLGTRCARHAKVVVLAWVVVLLTLVGGAVAFPGTFSGGFTLPPTQASQVLDEMDAAFPDAHFDEGTATAVVRAREGMPVTDNTQKAAIGTLVTELSEIDGVRAVLSPFDTGAVSENSEYALIQIGFDSVAGDVTLEQKDALQDAAKAARDSGLTVEFGGSIFQGLPEVGLNEGGGLIVALIVLIIVLGGMIAAIIPLVSGIVGVGIGVSGVFIASGAIDVNQLTPLLPAMLGLAVGIDYSLFVISRYQNELADGRDRTTAIGRAVGTAGTAVVFAGLTVLIALALLTTVGLALLAAMGIAAAGTVAVSILIAVTLTPALLSLAGDKITPKATTRATTADDVARPSALRRRPHLAERWVRAVTRLPWLTVVATLLVLGLLSIPALSMRLNFPDNSMAAPDTTQYKASQMIDAGFGSGSNGPLVVFVTSHDATAAGNAVATILRNLDDVTFVSSVVPNTTNDAAYIQVVPSEGPLAASTASLVGDIRDNAARWSADAGAESLQVTGQTAIDIDSGAAFSEALVPYLALVVTLALLLLLVMFRSILVPLKAALGFVLSVGATFGVVVAVFQWGWGAELLGVHTPGPIVSLLPLALTGVLFGLAMDYEVFIVSRMREEFVHHGDAGRSVRLGFLSGARVVVAAAIIMISVFAGFVLAEDTLVKSIAFALAVGVFIDAFIVRATLVPAIMTILGRGAWWIPRWLDRILPNIDTEGTALTARTPAPQEIDSRG
ncbi:RND superfamily putative drug exporter [Microbacterium proteolyticum]|uniref:RND superfamily putative drug exporter n=1 Tax=Microbacterium proteolyticum TaxID=1572644 RepID=A0A7W5GEG5_9MICO|nr:MMPL family transporter [Microbacterium proteolyticum]MBB3156458.1 RND superfamily putative drug exporter [Microbacterium proteolyticum]